MDMDQAPEPIRGPDECDCGGCYVMFEGNKICRDCGHIHGSGIRDPTKEEDDWTEWQRHRRTREEYSGWHGENRIRMVGGFARVYDWGADPL